MEQLNKEQKMYVAVNLATSIRNAMKERTAGPKPRITHSTLSTSYALHIALESMADELEVDKVWFKNECGVGQPLAYFPWARHKPRR